VLKWVSALEADSRELRGLAILAQGSQIIRLSGLRYKVRSQSGNGSYLVAMNNFREWTCEWPDYTFRHVTCKHIHAVKFSLNLRRRITSENLDLSAPTIAPEICKFCGSAELVRRGFRKTKTGRIQRFSCKNCSHRFVVNTGFQKRHYDAKAITAALDLYFKGVSFRNIADHLKQFFGRKPSQSTVHDWLKRYVAVAKEHVDRIVPTASGFWHVDEMKVNVDGNLEWLWNLMDDDTRFCISSLISQRREAEDARRVFQDSKKKLQAMPIAVTHDGLQSYHEAFKNEFYTNTKPQSIEVRSISIRERGFNNRMERLNQTFRDRNKTQRGLDSRSSAQEMSEAIRVAYNFVRPHMALDGKTPAEAAGINLQLGQNRWQSLIQQASLRKVPRPNTKASSP